MRFFIFIFALILGIEAQRGCRIDALDKARRKIQICKNKDYGFGIPNRMKLYALIILKYCKTYDS